MTLLEYLEKRRKAEAIELKLQPYKKKADQFQRNRIRRRVDMLDIFIMKLKCYDNQDTFDDNMNHAPVNLILSPIPEQIK